MNFEWSTPVLGAYCERTSLAFWGEPLNAVTSLLVIVFGLAAAAYLALSRRITPLLVILIGLAVVIGAGSFLFHTFATRWAQLADVLPIWAFVVVYSVAVMRKFSPDPIGMAALVLLGFVAFGAGTALSMGDTSILTDKISGSSQYLPAGMMILIGGRIMWKDRHPSLPLFGAALVLFLLALTFRSLDMPLCRAWPVGTHFLWHLTNCAVFWLLLRALSVRPPVGASAEQGPGNALEGQRSRLSAPRSPPATRMRDGL